MKALEREIYEILEKAGLGRSELADLASAFRAKYRVGLNWPRRQIILKYDSNWTKLDSVCGQADSMTNYKENVRERKHLAAIKAIVEANK